MKKKRLLVLLPAVLMMLGSCDPADNPSSSTQPDDDTSSVVPVVEKGSVTITAAEHAKVVADKSECEVGKIVNFTITLDSGYELEFFKINGADVEVKNNKASAQMVSGGLTVTYGAKQITYGVTITSVEHVQVTADKMETAAGDIVTFTVTPEENYELVSFKVNGLAREVKEGKATATMVKGGLTAVAEVKTVTYGVTIDSGIVNGTVTADKSEAAEGEDVTFTITPDDDFTIATFKVNDADVAVVDGKATVKMVKQGLHATATFSANVHNVTIPSNIEHGSVVADKATAVKGEVVTFTVTADADYDLDYFKVNGVDVAVDNEGKATYTMAKEDLVVTVNFVEHYDLVSAIDDEFKAKVTAAENIKYRLADNMSADELPIATKVTVIDLNGKTLTVNNSHVLHANDDDADQEVTVKNGKIVIACDKGASDNIFQMNGAKALTLQNVEISTDNEMGFSAAFHTVGTGTFTLDGCTVNAKVTYGISTNNIEGASQTLNIRESTLNVSTEDGDNCAVLLNVDGDGYVNIENSTISADRQAVIARTGEWSIKNSVLTNTGKFLAASEGNKTTNNNYVSGTWKNGNEVPSAPLVVGDTVTGAYKKDAKVTLEGVTGFSTGSDLIVARNDGTCATELNLDGLSYLNSYGKTDIGAGVTTTYNNVKGATIKEMNALTAADATNLYMVHGYIKKITNASYGNAILVDDEGNALTIYSGYTADSSYGYGYANGKYSFEKSNATIIDSTYVGKEVTVFGTFDVFNGTKEIKNAIAFVEQSDANVVKQFDETKGAVTLSKEDNIKTGDEITITVTPATGYRVSSIKVTQYGETTDITDTGKFYAALENTVAVEFESDSTPVVETKTETFVPTGSKKDTKALALTQNEITLSFSSCGDYDDSLRMYKNSTLSVSVKGDFNITSIVFEVGATGANFNLENLTATDYSKGTWTGSASKVDFTNSSSSAQIRFSKITVKYVAK